VPSIGVTCVRTGRDASGAPALLEDLGDGVGRPFRFVLGNAYYLMEEAARGRDDILDETLGKLAGLGVRVVRAWAFNDDPDKPDRDVRRGLDRLLAKARAQGIYLVLPLVNYWDAYGGARQWCRDAGLVDAQEGDARFFTDHRVRERFFAHVAALLDRVNPETRLRYGDDPVVLAWELMNEPRGVGLEGDELVGWVREAARVVHAHARQLVSTGEEGHEPWFSQHVRLPEIDLASAHYYPEKYGIPAGLEREAGERYITEHAAIARAAGKPLYVGELGLGNEGAEFARSSLDERRAIYRAWFDVAARSGVAGIGPWLFAHDARPDAWDDFTFYWKDGTAPDAPVNRYADLLAEAAARFSAP
jgi:mannan endo-1,4-beta-mannosidase